MSIRHIIPISGKDSLAAAILQTTLHPQNKYEFIFNDTKCELPEVYAWLETVESKLGWSITRLETDLEKIIQERGGFLPSINQRYCTQQAKIKPMDSYLGKDWCVVYFGLRADEDRVGYIPTRSNNIRPAYPLIDNKITLPMVWSILETKGLCPPSFFWERLYKGVCDRLDEKSWVPLEKWQFRSLFSGRTRANCYFCFFQRLSELLWLYETHPTHFERALSFEKNDYTWVKDYPLSLFSEEEFRDRIFNKAVERVYKVVSGAGKTTVDNAISQTSCGLICGK